MADEELANVAKDAARLAEGYAWWRLTPGLSAVALAGALGCGLAHSQLHGDDDSGSGDGVKANIVEA